jgi:electron transfer flavoprotein alpha subunit
VKLAVLVKIVPNADSVRYDPERRTVVRDGAELFVNPFDLRALAVALRLRRPGETVTVVSLGPPHARSVLATLKPVGVDRVLLLSDPALAGSDVLASARALAAALRTLGAGLVLAGARTTDSETAEVPPEVAALLGVPVVTDARSMERAADDRIEVTVDTPTGWARVALAPPAVVSVGEKISKPVHPDPDTAPGSMDSSVELVDLDALGVDPASVGALGSPTVVLSVHDVAPVRSPVLFADGPVGDRVRGAIGALASRLGAPRRGASPIPPAAGDLRDEDEIAMLVSEAHGSLDAESLAILGDIRRLAPLWPSAAWIGGRPGESESIRISAAGALRGYHLASPSGPVGSEVAAESLARLLDRRPRLAAVVVLSEPFGREVAGRLAGARGLGLVGDAVELRRGPDGELLWEKPSFGGRTMATIHSRTRPSVVTVRPGVAPPSSPGPTAPSLAWTEIAGGTDPGRVTVLAEGDEVDRTAELERREVLVSVGLGVGGPAGIDALRRTVDRWGAGLVATRRVVDAGWLPHHLQIGLTGRAIAPRLVVLLGVRGTSNHMIGWKRAGAVLGVNPDPAAPLFHEVDVGIVGTIEEVVPLLEAPLARLLRR